MHGTHISSTTCIRSSTTLLLLLRHTATFCCKGPFQTNYRLLYSLSLPRSPLERSNTANTVVGKYNLGSFRLRMTAILPKQAASDVSLSLTNARPQNWRLFRSNPLGPGFEVSEEKSMRRRQAGLSVCPPSERYIAVPHHHCPTNCCGRFIVQ